MKKLSIFVLIWYLIFSLGCGGKLPFQPYSKDIFHVGDLVKHVNGKTGILVYHLATEYHYDNGQYYKIFYIRFFEPTKVLIDNKMYTGIIYDKESKPVHALDLELLDIREHLTF